MRSYWWNTSRLASALLAVALVSVGLTLAVPAPPAASSAACIGDFGAISGANEVPPNASPASGSGTYIYDRQTKLLSWSLTHDLTNLVAAHIHGPAAPGSNAGVVVNVGSGGLTSPMSGSTTLTAGQEADFLAGLWYVNFHTNPGFPGGEIRGQLSQCEDRGLTLVSSPCAVYDSTTATAAGLAGSFAANESRDVQVTGTLTNQGGAPSCLPAGVTSAVLSISAINPQAPGNLRASAAGVIPTGGVVNYSSNGLNNANTVTVPVSVSGQVAIAANAGATDVRIVAIAYHPIITTEFDYVPLTPCAVADSRSDQGATGSFVGPFAAGDNYPDIDLVGTFNGTPAENQGGNNTDCGVPTSGVDAVIVNVVAVGGSGGTGGLAVGSQGSEPTEIITPFSTLPLNNAASTVIPFGLSEEKIAVNIESIAGTPSTHIRVIVLGYTDKGDPGQRYVPVNPCAAFDSRTELAGDTNIPTGAFAGKRTAGTTGSNLTGLTTYDITDAIPAAQGGELDCNVPSGATAVLINLVAIQGSATGNFTAFAAGSSPTGGVLNFAPLTPVMNNSNVVAVPLSAAGQMDLFVNAPSDDGTPTVHARGVIVGYYEVAG